jgi:hypothetical protein
LKLVTEFSVFKLKSALAQHAELTSSGKTPEEIEQSMGEAHKLEGEKLKYFVGSLNAAKDKAEGLKRVLVVTFAEDEKIPSNAQKIEEHYYLLENFEAPKKAAPIGDKRGGGKGGGGGGGRGGPGGGGKGKKEERDYSGSGGSKAGAKAVKAASIAAGPKKA